MADLFKDQFDQFRQRFLRRFVDQGDGSHAELVVTSPIASESHLGAVGGHSAPLELVLSLDNNAYGSGDVLAATQALANAVRVSGGTALLDMVQVLDEDDQGGALDILFFRSNVDIGAENGAFDITDAEARELLGWINVAAADYTDFGGWRLATIKRGDTGFKASVLKPTTGTSLYVAVISRDTKTYSAAGVRLILHVFQD